MFIRVDLPEPLEPMKATNSPRANLQRDAAHGVHLHLAGAVGLVHVLQPNDSSVPGHLDSLEPALLPPAEGLFAGCAASTLPCRSSP